MYGDVNIRVELMSPLSDDASRVILKAALNQPGTDYINASRIDVSYYPTYTNSNK